VLVEAGRVVGVRGRSARGAEATYRARVVVGADGRHSVVSAAVGPQRYRERAPIMAPYYAYWSGLPMDGRFEVWMRPHRGFAAAPTNDGLTVVVAGWPYAEFAANKKDVWSAYRATLEAVPEFAERLRGARRETRLVGAPTPNFFAKPYGPGWALAGDAGYLKDPITAMGISDAFRDAELCAGALHAWLSDALPFEAAMTAYQQERDAHALPMFEYTCQLATLEPPPDDVQALLAALVGNRRATDDWVRMNAGTISPADFLAPANVAAILGSAREGSVAG
jgi:flavin-dependent dehydrogenase